jgi:hypothetical protein
MARDKTVRCCSTCRAWEMHEQDWGECLAVANHGILVPWNPVQALCFGGLGGGGGLTTRRDFSCCLWTQRRPNVTALRPEDV